MTNSPEYLKPSDLDYECPASGTWPRRTSVQAIGLNISCPECGAMVALTAHGIALHQPPDKP